MATFELLQRAHDEDFTVASRSSPSRWFSSDVFSDHQTRKSSSASPLTSRRLTSGLTAVCCGRCSATAKSYRNLEKESRISFQEIHHQPMHEARNQLGQGSRPERPVDCPENVSQSFFVDASGEFSIAALIWNVCSSTTQ